jgi:hypothetical protein
MARRCGGVCATLVGALTTLLGIIPATSPTPIFSGPSPLLSNVAMRRPCACELAWNLMAAWRRTSMYYSMGTTLAGPTDNLTRRDTPATNRQSFSGPSQLPHNVTLRLGSGCQPA